MYSIKIESRIDEPKFFQSINLIFGDVLKSVIKKNEKEIISNASKAQKKLISKAKMESEVGYFRLLVLCDNKHCFAKETEDKIISTIKKKEETDLLSDSEKTRFNSICKILEKPGSK